MDRQRSEHVVSRTAASPNLDEFALGIVFVLLCALPFILGDQATSLVSAEQMGVTNPKGDAGKQAILASMYAAFSLLLLARTRAAEWTAIGIPLALLLVLCFASAAWSDLPGVSFRRSLALAGTVVIGTYAGLRLDQHRIMRVLLASSWVVLLASFAVAALLPVSGLDSEGRLRGVFAHKNGIGSFAALSLLFALVYLPSVRPGRSRVLLLALALPCTAALALAGSVTPTIALVFALAVVMLQARHGPRACVLPLVAALATGLLSPLFAWEFGDFAQLFGRDSEFSGRTRVWLFSLEFLERNPVLGYGYGAFWLGPAPLIFQRWSGFPVPNAHNGYLDLALGVGIPGAALAVVAVGRLIWALARAERADPDRTSPATAAFVAFLLVTNIAEDPLVTGNEILTLLFVYMVVRANLAARARIEQDDIAVQPTADRRPHRPGVQR